MGFSLFERTWQRAKRWGVLLLQPGEMPASNNSLGYLKAAYALEELGHTQAGLVSYRRGAERWSDVQGFWLAKSNLEYRLGDVAQAADTLRNALERHPRAAALWNNYAYVLAEQGCRMSAMNAISCALQLSPDEENYLQSQNELKEREANTQVVCPQIACQVSLP